FSVSPFLLCIRSLRNLRRLLPGGNRHHDPDADSETHYIREEREAGASLSELPRVSLLTLPALFTRLTTHRERQRPQPSFSDLAGALHTGPVVPRVEPDQRLVDAFERL